MTAAASYPKFDGTQACAAADVDPEVFFGDKGDHVGRIRAALDICSPCTFRRQCAAYALTHDVRGIWGGLTEPTRRAVQREHGIKPQQLELSDTGTRAEEVRQLAAAGTPPRLIAERTGIWLESVYRILGRTTA